MCRLVIFRSGGIGSPGLSAWLKPGWKRHRNASTSRDRKNIAVRFGKEEIKRWPVGLGATHEKSIPAAGLYGRFGLNRVLRFLGEENEEGEQESG